MARVIKQPEQKYVSFKIDRIETDPTAYKPYSHTLIPADNLVVMIPVDADEVSQGKGEVTLTLNGFMCVLKNVADAIEVMHNERLGTRR